MRLKLTTNSQKKTRPSPKKATGWPRPERKLAKSMGLNPLRMAALIVLALVGVLGGYLLGKYVKPEAPPAAQNQPESSQSSNNNDAVAFAPKETESHEHYEESLPRDIVIQENGKLKRIALPEPDVELDFGPLADSPQQQAPESVEKEIASENDNQITEGRDTDSDTEPSKIPSGGVEEAAIATKSSLVRAMPEDLSALLETSSGSLPPWLRNAVPTELDPNRPKIVIVIDDLGLNRSRARRTVALPGPLTLSYMAYAEALGQQTKHARAAGHELLLHVPMEPRSQSIDPGPNVLLSGIPREELLKSINWNLDQVNNVVGINNHMGSRFTSDIEGMETVSEVLSERGLLFLDSVTSGSSVAHIAAENAGIPFAVRNVFLDHEDDLATIKRQLRLMESIATRTGVAIGIGHPRDKTLEALAEWLPILSEKGFQLVPISAVAKIKSDRT